MTEALRATHRASTGTLRATLTPITSLLVYAALSLKRLAGLMLWPFGAVIVVLLIYNGVPTEARGWYKLISSALAYWTMLLTVVFGFSGRWAPWRLLWQLVPALNKSVFPDLNGVWVGTTSSNWSRIAELLRAAEETGGLDRQKLPAIPLQQDDVTMTITASLFAFRIKAQLHRTGAKSRSLTERVSKDKRRDLQELYYVYQQDTPDAVATDEDSHVGAAALEVDTQDWTLEGSYWTKRSWRSGLNTAGVIKVARQSR